ncbi:MAG: hypothetical protein WCB11_13980 [Terriglobales bacterium]
MPARRRERAYAGFAINHASTLIAHPSAAATDVLVWELVLLLAPSARHACERLTGFQGQVVFLRWF